MNEPSPPAFHVLSRRRMLARSAAIAAAPALIDLFSSSPVLAQQQNDHSHSPGPRGEDLLELARRFHADHESAPALAVGTLIDGSISVAATGRRARTADTPVTADDLWHIGSNTKSMTATLAARLIEQDTLDWDTTLGETLGADIPEEDNQPWRSVTLHQLLTHRAGIAGGIGNPGIWTALRLIDRDTNLSPIEKRARACRLILLQLPLSNEPGEAFEYSNFGYILAGAMLEHVTGTLWEDLMRRELAKPLGMTTLGFGPPGELRDATPTQPLGHSPQTAAPADPSEPAADNPKLLGPAGTAHCSIADFLRYAAVHANDGNTRDAERYLTQQSINKLHESVEHYACGFGVLAEKNRPTILQHAGSNTMWFHLFEIEPDTGRAFVTACNSAEAEACVELLKELRASTERD